MPEPNRTPDDNPLTRGSSGSTADAAVSGRPTEADRSQDAPAARPAPPVPEDGSFDQLSEKVKRTDREPGA